MLTKCSALKGIWAGPPRSEGAQNLNNGQSLALETCIRSRIYVQFLTGVLNAISLLC